MCLRKIIKQTMPNEGECYKVFQKDGDILKAPIRDFSFIEDCWLLHEDKHKEYCSCNKNILSLFRKKYKHAFHAYKNIEDARILKFNYALSDKFDICRTSNFVIRKIKYKGYVAEDDKQLVFEQIYVPSSDALLKIPCGFYYGSTFNSILTIPISQRSGNGPGYNCPYTIEIEQEEYSPVMEFIGEKFEFKKSKKEAIEQMVLV